MGRLPSHGMEIWLLWYGNMTAMVWEYDSHGVGMTPVVWEWLPWYGNMTPMVWEWLLWYGNMTPISYGSKTHPFTNEQRGATSQTRCQHFRNRRSQRLSAVSPAKKVKSSKRSSWNYIIMLKLVVDRLPDTSSKNKISWPACNTGFV